MADMTNEILEKMAQHMRQLQALKIRQGTLNGDLARLERDYAASQVTHDALDARLEVLTPEHIRLQAEIDAAMVDIEALRPYIFRETGVELPLIE